MKKTFVGHLIAGLGIALGVVGILLQIGDILPPALDKPIVGDIMLIVGILIAGLGYQEELERGTADLIKLLFDFFTKDPYWRLGVTAAAAAIKAILEANIDIPTGVETAFILALLFLQVVGFQSARSFYRIKISARR